jgi:DNA-binding MarR family transcriptional regulator
MGVKRAATSVAVMPRGAPRLTYLVKQLQEALLARLDAITRPFGLTAKQYTALSALRELPGLSSAALGRLTFVTPQAANEMVMTLEGKGFLTRSVDQSNRRCLEAELTRAGTRALTKIDELVDALELEVFGGIGTADQAQLRRMVHACLDALSRPEAHR